MPLYELVLQKGDGADETRFTDHEPDPGQPVLIDGMSEWHVVATQPPTHALALRRYLCVRADAA